MMGSKNNITAFLIWSYMEDKPHILVLGMLRDSPISMGKQLLCSCMVGENEDRIKRFRLDRVSYFGGLPLYDKKDVSDLIDLMVRRGLLELKPIPDNHFIKVIWMTDKGKGEFDKKEMDLSLQKDFSASYSSIELVTDDDLRSFSLLGNSLDGMSDEQKKAVICDAEKVLCIAGAGSGKTKVLTRRAWFLASMKSVDSSSLLAITFTRKARQEMISRIDALMPGHRMQIETFNSFCESILRKDWKEVYDHQHRVMDYSTKVKMVMKSMSDLGLNTDAVLDLYYTDRKIMSNDKKTLFLGFVNDLFSLMDYQKNNKIDDHSLRSSLSGYPYIFKMIENIEGFKQKNGFRDFTDQMVHVIDFFRKDKDKIPRFEHILVDEYQDINTLQDDLLQLLAPKSLFAVGDPRQSIYGWRGSKIEYILKFDTRYPGARILQLSANYRSTKNIVELCNNVIKPMRLPPLESCNGEGENVFFIQHSSDDAEAMFVCQSILSSEEPRKNIFVLARTNKQIDLVAEKMSQFGIKALKRTVEDMKASVAPTDEEVTLSTIHAIKGLEAEIVYIIGAGAKNHPCKASEHPVLEAVKSSDDYDKYAEELRLLYVGLSRAKKRLVVSYTGTLSGYFGNSNGKGASKLFKEQRAGRKRDLYQELRDFRRERSDALGIAPYQIFNDKTLQELCDERPLNMEELADITGLGSFKVRRWGKDILRILRDAG
jgi:superfamily I DNA/RNA helicase